MAEKDWTPLPLVKTTTEYFEKKDVPSPRLDAELLLCSVLACTRMELYAGFERPLTTEEVSAYRDLVRRRALREPVARILGRREFMGIEFLVNADVLCPRPDTEILVEEAIKIVRGEVGSAQILNDDTILPPEFSFRTGGLSEDEEIPEAARSEDAPKNEPEPVRETQQFGALDLGTGSGCIAVSLAAHCPNVTVVASDISDAALSVARENAENAGVSERIELRTGDLFSVCAEDECFDLILSNPPYLVEGDTGIWPEVREYDPPQALYGGEDGFEYYRRIALEAKKWLNTAGTLFLEIGAEQADGVSRLLEETGAYEEIERFCDFSGIERVLKARKRDSAG